MSDLPYKKAREQFNTYAAMDTPELPADPGSALQVMQYRWVMRKVPKHSLPMSTEGILGTVEEIGELNENLLKLYAAVGKLAHYELNASQGRRGYDKNVEALRALVADAIGDAAVFLMSTCTPFRLDFWTLVRETAMEVMGRDWVARPLNAHHEELPDTVKPICRACESEHYLIEKTGLETQSHGHTCAGGCAEECGHPVHLPPRDAADEFEDSRED